MRRIDRFYKVLVLAALFISVFSAVSWAQKPQSNIKNNGVKPSNTGSSHTGVDLVHIEKITPRTAASVPVGCKFPIFLNVNFNLQTAKSGTLKARSFLWTPGKGTGKGAYKKGLAPLCESVSKTVKHGKNSLDLSLPVLNMPENPKDNTQLITVVSLQTENGKEVAWDSSYNFIRGRAVIMKTAQASPKNAVTLLSYSPKAGNLTVGTSHEFSYKFQYSLKDKDWAFVNFELCDAKNDLTLGPWHCAAVPVPKGSGVVKYVSERYFFPYALKFGTMRLGMHYRTDPLGGTADSLFYGDWNLKAPAQ